MPLLIPDEDLQRSLEKYEAEQARLQNAQPRKKNHAEILLECYRDFPGATVAEFSEASGRSPSWVRKVLRQNGLKAAKAPRQRRVVTEMEQ